MHLDFHSKNGTVSMYAFDICFSFELNTVFEMRRPKFPFCNRISQWNRKMLNHLIYAFPMLHVFYLILYLWNDGFISKQFYFGQFDHLNQLLTIFTDSLINWWLLTKTTTHNFFHRDYWVVRSSHSQVLSHFISFGFSSKLCVAINFSGDWKKSQPHKTDYKYILSSNLHPKLGFQTCMNWWHSSRFFVGRHEKTTSKHIGAVNYAREVGSLSKKFYGSFW